MSCRLLVLSNIPNPYNDALFAEVAKQPDVELLVAYCAETEPNRDWRLPRAKGYDYKIMRGIRIGTLGGLNPGAISLVRRFRPTVAVITGSYRAPTMQMVSWWLTRRRVPWFYWSEALKFDDQGKLRNTLRNVMRKTLYHAKGFLAIGTRAAQSFEAMGISDGRIQQFHYYADTSHFEMPAARRAAHRARVRQEQQLPTDATVILYVGQLVHRKGVDILLRALSKQTGDRSAHLLIVGNGPQSDELRELADSLRVGKRTRFTGFIQPAELPKYMAAADVIVVPSRFEGWALVVPEAMVSGLVVIASNEVPAAVDLIGHGESGYIFPSDDDAALAQVLDQVCGDASLRERVVRAGRDAVAPERTSVAAKRLVQLVCDSSNVDAA